MINKPPPLKRDYNRDPYIKALKRRGFINHGSTLVRTIGWSLGVPGSELGICEPGILRFRRARHVEDVGVQQVPFQVCIGSIPHPVMSTKKDYGRCIEALLIPNLRAIALGWIDRRIAQIKLAQTTLGPEKNQSSQSGLGCRSKVGSRDVGEGVSCYWVAVKELKLSYHNGYI